MDIVQCVDITHECMIIYINDSACIHIQTLQIIVLLKELMYNDNNHLETTWKIEVHKAFCYSI